MPRQRQVFFTVLFSLIWLAGIGCGLQKLLSYEMQGGAVGRVPMAWPAGSKIPRAANSDTLVVLAHPHCPCTVATVGELARIMAEVQGRVTAYVLFLKPNDAEGDWEDSALRRKAAAIPGVTVLTDFEGTEAQRFGVETSGHALLFDPSGQLLFNGGITASRGHAGDNRGESAIVSLVNQGEADTRGTPVFGCSLFDPRLKEPGASCRR